MNVNNNVFIFILTHTHRQIIVTIIVKWLPHVYSNHFRLPFYGLQINILCICCWFRILYSLAAAPDMEWTTRPANFCCFCTQCQHLRGEPVWFHCGSRSFMFASGVVSLILCWLFRGFCSWGWKFGPWHAIQLC